jgi:hypothetical protein
MEFTALTAFTLSAFASAAFAQTAPMANLAAPHDYIEKRVSSYDKSGGNADAIPIAAGATATILDVAGPGMITHIWFTIASPEDLHLKRLVMRIYWDDEATPSVEAPVGDFFGL